MNRREKIATLLGLLIEPRKPSELEPETRVLLGLPRDLPGGGYGIEDVKVRVVETLAGILAEPPKPDESRRS